MSKQLEAKLAKLNKQIELEHARFRGAVAGAVVSMLDEIGLSLADLTPAKSAAKSAANGTRKTARKTAKAKTAHKRGPQPPKYRDPKTGATWSGIARPPAWIANAKDRTKFLIDKAA